MQREIATRMREAVKAAGIKQVDLASRLKKSQPAVSAMLAGDSAASVETIAFIAKLTGVTTDWLITGKEPPTCVVREESEVYQGKDRGIEFELVEEVLRQFPEPERFRQIGDLKERLARYLRGEKEKAGED